MQLLLEMFLDDIALGNAAFGYGSTAILNHNWSSTLFYGWGAHVRFVPAKYIRVLRYAYSRYFMSHYLPSSHNDVLEDSVFSSAA
jgi:hypothetical protein